MGTMIFCHKLKREEESLDKAPFPGALGEQIFKEISRKAWGMWLAHQTMLINEYRLSLIDPKAREFLSKEMKNFLYGEGSAKPAGFTPEE